MKVILIMACLMLSGCAVIPGAVITNTSKVTGVSEVSTKPAWCGDSIKLSLFKNGTMEKGDVVLKVTVNGSDAFQSRNSLTINIDGDIKTFSPINKTTLFEINQTTSNPESSNRFLLTTDIIKKMVGAKSAFVRVDMASGYLEGNFSSNMIATAKSSFIKFMDAISE